MISLQDVTLGGPRNRLAVGPIGLEFGPGLHALVGPSAEGGPLLLSVLAGARKLRSGSIFVLGRAPAPRPNVGWVPLAPTLPSGLRCHELLSLAARLRPISSDDASSPGSGRTARVAIAIARDRLDAFGLGALTERRVEALGPEEAHAVALVETLTSRSEILLLEEPLASLDARAAKMVVESLRARAAARGEHETCIVIATASLRDAETLGASVWNMRGGLCVRAETNAPSEHSSALRIRGPALEALKEALSADERTKNVDWQESDLIVRGSDTDFHALAAAVNASIATSGAVVDTLEPLAPSRSLAS